LVKNPQPMSRTERFPANAGASLMAGTDGALPHEDGGIVALHSIVVTRDDVGGNEDAGHVAVSSAEDGGWDITATLDGRVVASRHCYDWHRVERARKWVETELHAQTRRHAGVAVVRQP
jgi:hypothetical protein